MDIGIRKQRAMGRSPGKTGTDKYYGLNVSPKNFIKSFIKFLEIFNP